MNLITAKQASNLTYTDRNCECDIYDQLYVIMSNIQRECDVGSRTYSTEISIFKKSIKKQKEIYTSVVDILSGLGYDVFCDDWIHIPLSKYFDSKKESIPFNLSVSW